MYKGVPTVDSILSRLLKFLLASPKSPILIESTFSIILAGLRSLQLKIKFTCGQFLIGLKLKNHHKFISGNLSLAFILVYLIFSIVVLNRLCKVIELDSNIFDFT
jgi:hypothetical protein